MDVPSQSHGARLASVAGVVYATAGFVVLMRTVTAEAKYRSRDT